MKESKYNNYFSNLIVTNDEEDEEAPPNNPEFTGLAEDMYGYNSIVINILAIPIEENESVVCELEVQFRNHTEFVMI